jgi:hexosaminidase
MWKVVPAPVEIEPAGGPPYELTPRTLIRAPRPGGGAEVAEHLAALLRRATGLPLPVVAADETDPDDTITLRVTGDAAPEAYRLEITPGGVVIRASTAAGLFYGGQTLRQLLPPAIESAAPAPGPWTVPAGRITDRPRYPYRGAMLDVVRHFLPVAAVRRYIDAIALYKVNHLHLHLSDDQGWRLEIQSWPRLAEIGGRSEVGGGPGGFYTQEEYADLVAYAARRHVTVVPEIDMPGHTNAALAAYPELNPDGTARPPYTGTEVGFSSLDAHNERTYEFVADVLREVAALTPGPYLHLGGDEAHSTRAEDYALFLSRVQPLVTGLGKTVMGWHQMAATEPSPGRVLQFWGNGRDDSTLAAAVRAGARVVLSPPDRAYLDMKYDAGTPLGYDWAGHVDVRQSYEWEPGAYLAGVPAAVILGVEAPLWTETVTSLAEAEFLAFPRLPAIAELGWSPVEALDWASFRERLAAHGPRWSAMGVSYHASPQIPWPAEESAFR